MFFFFLILFLYSLNVLSEVSCVNFNLQQRFYDEYGILLLSFLNLVSLSYFILIYNLFYFLSDVIRKSSESVNLAILSTE